MPTKSCLILKPLRLRLSVSLIFGHYRRSFWLGIVCRHGLLFFPFLFLRLRLLHLLTDEHSLRLRLCKILRRYPSVCSRKLPSIQIWIGCHHWHYIKCILGLVGECDTTILCCGLRKWHLISELS